MGVKSSREGDERCLSECLLYAAICMVGLPVEVQVKDGSLYSGILHTASFDEGHGIVLKKARKIGKGKHEKNFTLGSIVDTLVVFSADFVQVVVKDFHLPDEGIVGAVAETVEFQANNVDSEKEKTLVSSISFSSGMLDHNSSKDAKYDMGNNVQKMLPSGYAYEEEVETRRPDVKKAVEPSLMPTISVQESQVGEDLPKGEASSGHLVDEVSEEKKVAREDHLHPGNVSAPQVDSVIDAHSAMISSTDSKEMRVGSPANTVRLDDHPERIALNSTNYTSLKAGTTASSHSTSVSNSIASSCPSPSTSPNASFSKIKSYCNPVTKEFKLNPGAEVFYPMSANSRSSPAAVPTTPNAAYIPHIPPRMPIAASQAGTEINSFASLSSPAKLVQYDSLVTGYNGVPAQYSRHVIGHASGWQQPVRFNGPYHHVQAGPAYVHPTSQTVMVGRMGQLVYVHPLAQDTIQAASVFSQGSHYPLLNPCQTNMPKIQGIAATPLQLCVAPPLVTGATQPFAVPSPAPFSQPFPAVRHILVPGRNGFFGSKFQ